MTHKIMKSQFLEFQFQYKMRISKISIKSRWTNLELPL